MSVDLKKKTKFAVALFAFVLSSSVVIKKQIEFKIQIIKIHNAFKDYKNEDLSCSQKLERPVSEKRKPLWSLGQKNIFGKLVVYFVFIDFIKIGAKRK